ncbi:hypothetical protein I79_007143 [Cricetulus griseus]|uniref:Uncharacterized protein n=1 Tax=Cricetulus griseus TaxID=10029 RepID=G3H9R3_CRIGR|nr:hypothetical protein I79_007143 [Cricetulus griseus]
MVVMSLGGGQSYNSMLEAVPLGSRCGAYHPWAVISLALSLQYLGTPTTQRHFIP